MADVSRDAVVEQLLVILDEAFSNSTRPWSYFTDPSPDSGYFGLLSGLDPSIAVKTVGGTSVAAQVAHVTFSMNASTAFIQGDLDPPGPERWKQSWQVPEMDEETWKRMQAQLREAYHGLRHAIESHGVAQVQSLGGAIGAIAHVAYHLGAIKQKLAIVGAT